jgi:hypothetical protein
MKLLVISDERGRIISLSIPGDVSGISGIGKAGVLAKAGQLSHTLEVPSEFQRHPLLELHRLLRVDGVGHEARLVSLDRFTETFLRGD